MSDRYLPPIGKLKLLFGRGLATRQLVGQLLAIERRAFPGSLEPAAQAGFPSRFEIEDVQRARGQTVAQVEAPAPP